MNITHLRNWISGLLCLIKRITLPSIFTLFILFSTSTTIYSQQELVDVSVEDISLRGLFDQLNSDYGYRFFYSEDVVNLDQTISLNLRRTKIGEILTILNQETGLVFQLMEDKLIVVSNIITQVSEDPYVISGRVVAAMDGLPLPGVNIVIKNTNIGVNSSSDGSYSIIIPGGTAILEYSFIGYRKMEIPVSGLATFNITLEEDVNVLDEVIVTALNINRDKSSLGYSITSVSSEDISKAKENNPINSLAGKVAGLQISTSPSGVDGSSRVILRGVASLSGGNRPLIIIDGIPVAGGSYGTPSKWGGSDRGDALSDLNPEDIESMSVLKGAGAAAAYGSRGANGVILIQTKTGSTRRGIGVSVNSNFIIETPLMLPDLQSEYGQGSFGRYPTEVVATVAHKRGEEPWIWSWGPKMEGQLLPDWLDNSVPFSATPNPFSEFYNPAYTTINTVAFNGGDANSSFRASVTNQNSTGQYPTNRLAKQTINIRGMSKLGERIKLDAKFVYIHNAVQNRPYLSEDSGNAGWSLSTLPRNISLSSLEENYIDNQGEENWIWDRTVGNPYWALYNKNNNDEKNRMQGLFSMNFELSERLTLIVRSGMDLTNRNWKEYAAGGSPVNSSKRGWMNRAFDNSFEINTDFLLSFSQPIGDDVNLNLNVGGNHRYNEYKSIDQGGSSWRVEDFYHMSNLETYWTSEYSNRREVVSLYGLGTFSYKNFVYLDFTYRNDWSSTLHLDNNAYSFYSGNLSFLFTDAFDISSYALSKGKFRLSLARVGNDTGPYKTTNYYSVNQNLLPYPTGGLSGGLADPNFAPEITNSWEVGIEVGMFGNAVDLDLAYYNAVSKNQIIDVLLAPSTGFTNMTQNAGEISNHGFEGLISGTPMANSEGLQWDISLNFSKNISKVVSLADGELRKVLEASISEFAFIEIRPGNPFGEIYGHDYKKDENGNRLITDQGSPIPSEYKKLGDINPDIVGGLSNRLSYKDFHISFLIDMQFGGEFYSQSLLYRDLMGTSTASLRGRDKWYSTHEGLYYSDNISGIIPRGYIEEGVNENTGLKNEVPVEPMMRALNTIWFDKIISDYILDATNIKMREIVIGYDLPQKWIEKTPLTRANISIVGRNLFFFYNASKIIDPESGYNSGSIGNAFEMNTMPTTRSYGFNITLNF